MRALSLQSLALVSDPIARAALQQVQDASQDNVINDVAASGAALATVKNAIADEIAYFTGATAVSLTALTPYARTLIAAANAAAALVVLGVAPTGTYLAILNNLSDLNSVPTARSNLGVTATGADTTYLFRANNLSDLGSISAAVATLGLTIGTNTQAFDAQLTSNIRQNSQSAAYTTVLADGERHIYHPSADVTARTWTIDSNANVAYPLGTAITFVNDTSAGVITIAIGGTDTMVLAGAGSTGSRSLAASGMATALKIGTTRWMIAGTGLT